MIEIKCDKCGTKSKNKFDFENNSFSYKDSETHVYQKIHLCSRCQKALAAETEILIGEFLGLEPLHRAVDFTRLKEVI